MGAKKQKNKVVESVVESEELELSSDELEPISSPAIGDVLEERYKITGDLGEGGIGSVYRAQHLKLGHEVAIKVLQPQYANHRLMRPRFEREAKALAKLTHPNIVSMLDYSIESGSPYLVMELLRGRTLLELIAEGPVPEEDARAIVHQACDALIYAHRLGFVHRDLKPANIFLVRLPTDSHHVKLLDFGFVKLIAEATNTSQVLLSQSGVAFGTPSYMSPEQATGDTTDERADLYGLGVILFELLAGRRPFIGTLPEIVRQHLVEPVPSLRVGGLRDASPELRILLDKAMAKEKDDRFQSAREFRDALDALPSPITLDVPKGMDVTVAVPVHEPEDSSVRESASGKVNVDKARSSATSPLPSEVADDVRDASRKRSRGWGGWLVALALLLFAGGAFAWWAGIRPDNIDELGADEMQARLMNAASAPFADGEEGAAGEVGEVGEGGTTGATETAEAPADPASYSDWEQALAGAELSEDVLYSDDPNAADLEPVEEEPVEGEAVEGEALVEDETSEEVHEDVHEDVHEGEDEHVREDVHEGEDEDEHVREVDDAAPAMAELDPVRLWGESPWDSRSAERLLTRAKRRLDNGHTLGRDAERRVMGFARTHRGDPRPHLVLARSFRLADRHDVAVERYDLAFRVDSSARADPEMLDDLLRIYTSDDSALPAGRLIVETYGETALPLLEERLSASDVPRADVPRLRALRQRIGQRRRVRRRGARRRVVRSPNRATPRRTRRTRARATPRRRTARRATRRPQRRATPRRRSRPRARTARRHRPAARRTTRRTRRVRRRRRP